MPTTTSPFWSPSPHAKHAVISLGLIESLRLASTPVGANGCRRKRAEPSHSAFTLNAPPISPTSPGSAPLKVEITGIVQKREIASLCGAAESAELGFNIESRLETFIGIRKGNLDQASTKTTTMTAQFTDKTTSKQDERLNDNPPNPSKDAPDGQATTKLLTPEVLLPAESRQFIVSVDFLQDRNLYRHLMQVYPRAELIERDNETCTAPDADVSVSPGTGIICTSLQKVKQRRLPGQEGSSRPFYDRITATALRYERLYVLVHLGEQADSFIAILSGADTMAYAEFVAFCSAMEPTVAVVMTPGGPAALARWLAALMIKHSTPRPQALVLQANETPAETMIRMIGFNAYAAQVIARTIQDEEAAPSDADDMEAFGQWTAMRLDVKKRTCAKILGGRRLISPVLGCAIQASARR